MVQSFRTQRCLQIAERIWNENLKHAVTFSLKTWISGAHGTGSTAVLLRDRDPLFVDLSEDLKSLKTLTVVNSDMRNLSWIISLEELEELHLVSCRRLTDLSALSAKHSLRALTFTDCEGVSNLSAIMNLKNLQWLGLPPATSQNHFDELIRTHNGLKVLELIKCKNIREIKVIGSLKKLESLVVLDGGVDDSQIRELKDLRFLVLPRASFEDMDDVEAIEEEHPPVC